MAGGPGKINEYNQSLSPEQRKESAIKAAKAPRPKSNIRRIARMINAAPAGNSLKNALAMLGIERDENLSNAAGIALAVYQAAINGDMKAVEKWERYVGQYIRDDTPKSDEGGVQIVDDL